MTLSLYEAKVGGAGGVAVPGAPRWPDAAHPYDEALARIYTANIAAWGYPGRRAVSGAPALTEVDLVDDSRQWASPNVAAALTAPTAANLGFWHFTRAAADGMRATLAAGLTSYTWAVIARATDFASPNGLAGIGSSTTRMGLYFNATQLLLQHGTGDITSAAVTNATGVWNIYVASFDASDKSCKLYKDSATPLTLTAGGTKANNPSNLTAAALGSFADGAQPAAADIAIGPLWNVPLKNDSAAMTALFAALNGIKALLP